MRCVHKDVIGRLTRSMDVALLVAKECHSGTEDAQLSPRRHRWVWKMP